MSSEKDPEGSFGETAPQEKKEQMCILRSGTRQQKVYISEQSNTQYVKKKRDAIKL
jgi:hypothetical protein